MANVMTLIFHHMDMLERSPNGGLHYSGGLASEKRLEPWFDLARGLRLVRTDDDVVNMCESALMNERKAHLYFEHPVIANPDVIEPVEVEDDTEVEYGGGDDVDVEQEPKNLEEKEVGDENHEKLVVASEVQSAPRQASPAQTHEVPIIEDNNAVAAKGDDAQ
ncbi:hypothetical protein PIB30_036679 [Stylosanthes scabra]|uniref:PB1-like domain-containing protein n=1 Tax=Stylosanthes scabra TaxID=79078 RepID=A0ABU6XBK2_9FABA|nr:hypothetical protein [Stylosanthes scabra]